MTAVSLWGVGHDVVDTKGARRPVLEQISFTVARGETVALMGPSGSGKSSILGCVAGLQDCSTGRVDVLGGDIQALDAAGRAWVRAHHVALLLQGDDLLPALTVRENVELLHRIRGERPPADVIDDALRRVGLADRSDELPEGLSGGERRRVALARVAVQPPHVTLLDEPTDGLDPRSVDAVVQMIRIRARAGAAVLVVTHDPRVASAADRVVFVDRGRVRHDVTGPTPEGLEAIFRSAGTA